MKMKVLMAWIVPMVVLLLLGFAEAGRAIFDASSREELVDLAGYGEEKLSTVLITGTILFQEHEDGLASTRPVSGVRVGVTCTSIKFSSEETSTDEFGDFIIDLPSHLHGTRNLDETCQVNIINVPEANRNLIEMKNKKMMKIKLASARNGVRTYTTGKIHLKRVKSESGVSVASVIVRLVNKLPIAKWRG